MLHSLNKNKTTKIGSLITVGLIATILPFTASNAVEDGNNVPEEKTITLMLNDVESEDSTFDATVEDYLATAKIRVSEKTFVNPSLTTELENDTLITVITEKQVRLKKGAQKTRKFTLAAVTVNDVLESRNLRLGQHDKITPKRTTVLDKKTFIKIDRIAFKKFTKRSAIKNKTVYVNNSSLYRGDYRVKKPGRTGVLKTTYKRKRMNSKTAWTRKINQKVVRKPVTKIVYRGTKERATLSGVWRSLAQCESGLNPNIVSSNGMYHGLFQFSTSTWSSVGGQGLPSRASTAEQLKRAKILQARSGWGQWPHCSSKLGLR